MRWSPTCSRIAAVGATTSIAMSHKPPFADHKLIRLRPLIDQGPVKVPGQVGAVAEGLVAGASAAAHRELGGVRDFSSVGGLEMDWSRDQVWAVFARNNGYFIHHCCPFELVDSDRLRHRQPPNPGTG